MGERVHCGPKYALFGPFWEQTKIFSKIWWTICIHITLHIKKSEKSIINKFWEQKFSVKCEHLHIKLKTFIENIRKKYWKDFKKKKIVQFGPKMSHFAQF